MSAVADVLRDETLEMRAWVHAGAALAAAEDAIFLGRRLSDASPGHASMRSSGKKTRCCMPEHVLALGCDCSREW